MRRYTIPNQITVDALGALLRTYFLAIDSRLTEVEALQLPVIPDIPLAPDPTLPYTEMDLTGDATTQVINSVLAVNCTVDSTLTIRTAAGGQWLTVINVGTNTITLSDGTSSLGTIGAGETGTTHGTKTGYSSTDGLSFVPL